MLFIKAHKNVDQIRDPAADEQRHSGPKQQTHQIGNRAPIGNAQIEQKQTYAYLKTGIPFNLHFISTS